MLGNLSTIRALVWTDYRLALLFAVFIPLTLLIWSWIKKSETVSLSMTIYWRVASLLGVTVYLMIAGLSIGFITALLAKILIVLSLWFWVDLNEEIREQPKRALHIGFSAWRWAMSAYCGIGAIIQLWFIRCAFSRDLLSSGTCQAWREPALAFKSYFHNGLTSGFLGFWGIVGLVIYAAYLGYFLLVKLGRQGRSALNQ